MSDKQQQNRPGESRKEQEAAGLPDKDSILSVEPFTSPKGGQYRILHTDEKDAYDAPHAPTEQAHERDEEP